MDAVLRKTDKGIEIYFDRHFRHPVAEAWAALTEPENLTEWLAQGSIELRADGRVNLTFDNTGDVIDAPVLEAKPNQSLVYGWSEDGADRGVVRWTLAPEGGGTHLQLTHTLPAGVDPTEYMAGWHAHLELLSSTLDDLPANWSNERWEALREHYENKAR